MHAFRKVFIAFGVLLLLTAGFLGWRSAHPAQTDEQVLRADLDAAVSGVQDRSVARVARFLAPDFQWSGTSRSEVKQAMIGAFWEWRDVQLQLTDEQVSVSGTAATTTGRFIISYRPEPDAAPETHSGNFTLQWRKKDGQWQVDSATGADNMR